MFGSVSAAPPVSVVVATHNRAGRLDRLLRSLTEQSLPERFEVVVVDDASQDETPAVLMRYESQTAFDLVTIKRNRGGGPAQARNEGWMRARGSLIAFTDDDCIAHPEWLAQLIGARDSRGGAEDEIIQGVTRPDPRERDKLGPFSHTRDVDGTGPWYETCNIAYPRTLLERLRGFDESFPEPLGEDTDLGWRAHELGAHHRIASSALVYHAIDDLGPIRHLQLALRGADGVLVFKRHPELRRKALRAGVIRNPAHVRLILAASGCVLTRKKVVRLLLALPYAKLLSWRCRRVGASLAYSPYFTLFDLLSLLTTLRGDIRHRILVI
jgi:glycosyltransferase involved in cell wall biosynthesis